MIRKVLAMVGGLILALAPVVRADPAGDFAASLYAHLPKDQNVICSPLSVYEALAMTAQGARGSTADEFTNVLGPEAAIQKRLTPLQTADADFTLHIANAIWVQSGLPILPSFSNSITQDFQGVCRPVDFSNGPAAASEINDWVNQQTSGKIPRLFAAGSLPAEAKMVLTNAVYFHADWKQKFEAERSGMADFYVDGRADAQPRMMMHEMGSFKTMHGDQFDAIELPYKGEKIDMLIILPKKADGLPAVEAGLTGKTFDEIEKGMDSQFLALSMPKFTFSYSTGLESAMAGMGLGDAMDARHADFSGIDGRRDLYIGAAVQKAFVAVDEAGTEAAAATGIVMMPTAIARPPVSFIVDHPFLFVIRDKAGNVLFMGRVSDPTGGHSS